MSEPEDLLGGYRPSGPPPDLRARIVLDADRATRSSMRDWLPALATAALIALLYVLATGIRMRVYEQIADPDAVRQIEVPIP